MAHYSPEPDDAEERREAETRLYQPVQQVPPAEPPEVDHPPAYGTNVNVATGSATRPADQRALAAARFNAVLMWLFGVIEALIAIRFILKAVGANATAAFATLIYGLTGPLVGPFVGVLATPVIGVYVIELPALLAIIIYFLISLLLTRLIRILFIDQPQLR